MKTARLTLRALRLSDGNKLASVAGSRLVADTTISVPHPFGADDATDLIERAQADATAGTAYRFAIIRTSTSEFIGYIGLHDVDREHSQAELSFWIDDAWTGQGIVTEAAYRVITFAFGELLINRLVAYHMTRNAASGRVLAKLGFKREGLLRQRVRKWNVFEDVVTLALLRTSANESAMRDRK